MSDTHPVDRLPKLRISAREFEALPEYSCSVPTGTTPGKRWKRLDGVYDRSFMARGGKPRWMVGEYDPACPSDAKTIQIFWYRPIIQIRAATELRA